ncbi:NRAMP family divalent metal transporter [Alishewanella tabrizica]|uniref:Membrane protein n=1 Tax=Alishewanella tabrizica TaxID=671278 RepID=A0ABQ2WJZ3_9ALTE|nr:divalent metal cation transporter [Alishewanella tabrizica]GGW60506.1 membrane protein [Alishewanella tabrizica]
MQQVLTGWRGRVQALGPGVLMATAAVGGSHLVASTQAGALFGWQLLWLIIVVNVLKYPFFRFGVQYTLEHNVSLVEGYWRKGKPYFYSFVLLNIVAAIVNTAGVLILTAALLQYALPWSLSIISLCWLILAACLLIILLGHYQALDNVAKLIMLLLTITTVVAALIAAKNGAMAPVDFVGQSPWQLAMLGFLVALMGWMPAPIEISAISSLWLKAKQQRHTVTPAQGLFDFNLGYWLTAALACVFVSLGALVQYGSEQPIALAGAAFAQQLVNMYGSTIGEWAKPLVSLIAFLCMFGTTLTVLDGYARTLDESGRLLGLYTRATRWRFPSLLLLQAFSGMAMIVFFRSAIGPMLTFAMTLAFLTTPVFAWLNFSLMRGGNKPGLSKRLTLLSWLGLAYLIGFAVVFLVWYLYQV